MPTLIQPEEVRVALPLDAIAEFCRRWKIAKLELFGSALRDEFRPESDLDFLYTFARTARWGWEFERAYDELERLVGRRVDLVSRSAVEKSRNPFRKRAILNTARVIYEE
jgi:predicted nucleotidyltransferase